VGRAAGWVITVYGASTFPGPRPGGQLVVVPVPPAWYSADHRGRFLHPDTAGAGLRAVAEACAAAAAEQLHHADWVVTLDRPAGEVMAAGALYWLAPAAGHAPGGGGG
jgi:hypothetical protein